MHITSHYIPWIYYLMGITIICDIPYFRSIVVFTNQNVTLTLISITPIASSNETLSCNPDHPSTMFLLTFSYHSPMPWVCLPYLLGLFHYIKCSLIYQTFLAPWLRIILYWRRSFTLWASSTHLQNPSLIPFYAFHIHTNIPIFYHSFKLLGIIYNDQCSLFSASVRKPVITGRNLTQKAPEVRIEPDLESCEAAALRASLLCRTSCATVPPTISKFSSGDKRENHSNHL